MHAYLMLLEGGHVSDREEGSNGDREMASAMWMSGLEPWDITMSDLLNGRASLDSFRGDGSSLPKHTCNHKLANYLSTPLSEVTRQQQADGLES